MTRFTRPRRSLSIPENRATRETSRDCSPRGIHRARSRPRRGSWRPAPRSPTISRARQSRSWSRPSHAISPVRNFPSATRYYLGLAYKKTGETEKADEILKSLEGGSAVAINAQFLLGQAKYEAGAYAEAIAPLERYLKELPDGDVADHALAYLAISSRHLGKTEAAQLALDELKRRFPKNKVFPSTALLLAESAYDAGDFVQAGTWFRAASETDDPKNRSKALSGLGWSLYQIKDFDRAAAAFDAASKVAPGEPAAAEARRMQGKALEAAGKADLALESYAQAARGAAKTKAGAEAALARARLLAKTKRPEQAAEAYAELLLENPKTGSGAELDAILAEQAYAWLEAGKNDRADAAFERILTEFPNSSRSAEARLYLAESAYQAKRFDAAEKLLAPLVRNLDSADPVIGQSALYRLGRCLVERKQWKDAEAAFDRLGNEFPSGSFAREARFWSAESAFQANEPDRALNGFSLLLEASTDQSENWTATARVRRIQCFVMQSKWNEAIEGAEAIAKGLTNAALVSELDYARGRAYQGMARFDEARTAYERAAGSRKQGDLAARAG